MFLEWEGPLRVLVSEVGKLVTDERRSFFSARLYLGVNAYPEDFIEVDESEKPIEEEQNNGIDTGQV